MLTKALRSICGKSVLHMILQRKWTYNFNQGEFVGMFFFCVTGAFILNPLHQTYFCEGFFEIGSHELFAWASFKPQSF
jgi:hypothetical protein